MTRVPKKATPEPPAFERDDMQPGASTNCPVFHFGPVVSLIESSPFVGLIVTSGNDHIVYADHAAAEMLTHTEAEHLEEHKLEEVLPQTLADVLSSPLSPDVCEVNRVVLFGWQLLITRSSRGPDAGFLSIVQRQPGMIPENWAGMPVQFVPMVGLGPLSLLTPREIEVTAWLGMGMSVRQISEQLNRSIKTIENHRIAIGKKLGVRDRMDIGLIAFQAGLRPEDSLLARAA